MRRSPLRLLAGAALLGVASCGPEYVSDNPADLILLNGDVYTMEEDHPWASAVVVTGNTITASLSFPDSSTATCISMVLAASSTTPTSWRCLTTTAWWRRWSGWWRSRRMASG